MTLPVVATPSSTLPPIRQIHDHPLEVLESLVEYLRTLYNPPVRGTRRINRKAPNNPSPLVENDEGETVLEALRADEFERAYAVRWLTGLVSRASLLPNPLEDDDTPSDGENKADALIRSATELIAVCAGTAAVKTLTRRYSFHAPSLNADVEISLTDVSIAVESDSATVGTQTWGSACLMAEMLVEDPERFGLSDEVLGRDGGVRVLELGAGTGLVSLVVAKFLSMRGVDATVVASDYHPTILTNLKHNIKTNFPSDETTSNQILLSAHALDWSKYSLPDALGSQDVQPPFDKPFDMILGADVVYEPTHASWIRDTVAALLPRPVPAGAPNPRFHLIMPLRPTHTSETRMVEDGFLPVNTSPSKLALCVLEKETIVCEVEDRRGSEVEYAHYVIGWA